MTSGRTFEIGKSNTRYLIVKTPNHVYKIGGSLKKIRYLHHEYNAFCSAKNSNTLISGFVPNMDLKSFYLKLKRYDDFSMDKKHLLDNYFSKLEETEWKISDYSTLLDFDYLNSILEERNIAKLKKYLESFEVPVTPAHRDFRLANILTNGNRLLFIDWPNYSSNSTYIFDLINLLVYSEKEYEEENNWNVTKRILNSKKILSKNPFESYYQKLEKHMWVAYIVDKVCVELRNNFLLHGYIPQSKIRKGKVIISELLPFAEN